MADKDNSETEKADSRALSKIIYSNCHKFHKFETLPETPFFLESENSASRLLADLLKQSVYDVKEFSRLAASTILKYRSIDLNFNISKASHLKESLEIDEATTIVQSMQNTSTLIFMKIVKAQSTEGPITVNLRLPNGKENALDEGDEASFVVSFNDTVSLEYLLDNDDQLLGVDNDKINVIKVVHDTYYLSAVQKQEVTGEIRKKGVDYEIKVEFSIRMSVNDRLAILNKRNIEVDQVINSTNIDYAIYNDLMNSLYVVFNEDEQCFISMVRRKKDRESCCEQCLIV